jgi:hypothetical protein
MCTNNKITDFVNVIFATKYIYEVLGGEVVDRVPDLAREVVFARQSRK